MDRIDPVKLKAQLAELYDEQYFKPGCFRSEAHPCGPDRAKLPSDGKGPQIYWPPAYARVGPHYGERTRVVFVGINPNLESFKDHRTEEQAARLFDGYLDPNNPGEWDEKAFRNGLQRMATTALGLGPADESLPFVAWTNLIKCASNEDRGRPSYRMKTFCSPRIWPELELLRPQLIITLGEVVHVTLTQGAVQRGQRATIPASPWSEFWSEIEVAGDMVGVFCAFHPSDTRTVNAAWAAIRDGGDLRNERISLFLLRVTGSDSPRVWKEKILGSAERDKGNPLVDFIERYFLANRQPIPSQALRRA